MEKSTKIVMTILVAAVLIAAVYAVVGKPAILGSPISCYVRCNENSNCGTDSTTRFCNGTYACMSSASYTCNNPGTSNSSCFGTGVSGCTPCTNGCSNGACIQGSNTTRCGDGVCQSGETCSSCPADCGACSNTTTNTTKVYTCTDSDGGLVYNVQGLTKEYYGGVWNKGSYDACVANTTSSLKEYYCSNNRLTSVTYVCSTSCSNGACKVTNSTGNSSY